MKIQNSKFNHRRSELRSREIQNSNYGFSLVEIVVTISILVFIASLGLSELFPLRDSLQIARTTEDVRSLLFEARSETLAGEDATVHGVHFETGMVALFAGETYVAPGNKELFFPPTVEIANITLSGGGADVVFKKLTGETEQDGSVVVAGSVDSTQTRIIYIEKTGTIRIE